MLLITGQYKGETVDQKPVNPKELMKEYGIELKSRYEFSLHKNMISFDPINKRDKFPPRIGPGPEFTGVSKDGGEIIIRYSERMPNKNPKTGYLRNVPNNVFFQGRNMLLHAEDNLEMVVWFLFHPFCEQSPIRRNTDTPKWRLDDREAEAKKEMEQTSMIMELIQEIANENNELKLRRIALGMPRGLSIPGSYTMPLAEIKSRMSRLAMDKPREFSYAYRDPSKYLSGTIQHAIRAGMIEQKGIGGGQSVYKWRKDINSGVEICKIPQGADMIEYLIGYLSDQTRFADFIQVVSKHVNEKQDAAELVKIIEKDTSKPVEELSGIELINLAESSDSIQYIHGKGVVILNNFVPEEPALHVVENANKWREELAKALDSVDIKRNRLVKRLKDGPKDPESDEAGQDEPKETAKKSKK